MTSPAPWRRALPWVAWVAALAFALAMTLLPQHRDGLWQDEVYSLENTRGRGLAHQRWQTNQVLAGLPLPTTLRDAGPAWDVWVRQRDEPHPPLYFLSLRVWREVFGESELAARSLSTCCWLGAIALASLAGGRAGGPSARVATALALGASAAGAWYGREIRDYAMAALWVSAALFAAVSFLRTGSWRWILAWAALATMGMLTHYFAAGPMLGMAVATLWLSSHRKRVLLAGIATATLFGIADLLPLLAQAGTARGYSGWIRIPESLSPWTTANWALGDIPGALGTPAVQGASLGAAMLAVAAWQCWFPRKNGAPGTSARPALVVSLLAIISGVGLIALMDLALNAAQLRNIRYLVPTLPAIGLLVGLTCAAKGWPRYFGWAVVLATGLANLDRPRLDEMMSWPTVVSEARALAGPDCRDLPLALFVQADRARAQRDVETRVDLLALMLAYHAQGWRGPAILLDAPPPAEKVARLTAGHDRALLVMAWRGLPPDTVLPGWRVESSRTLPALGASVLLMRPGRTPAPPPTSR